MNMLTPKLLNDFIYIQTNTMMIENLNYFELRNMQFIDLEKLNRSFVLKDPPKIE